MTGASASMINAMRRLNKMFSQNNVLICFCVTNLFCITAEENPKSLNITTNPVIAVTMATTPKPSGLTRRAITAVEIILVPNEKSCANSVLTPPFTDLFFRLPVRWSVSNHRLYIFLASVTINQPKLPNCPSPLSAFQGDASVINHRHKIVTQRLCGTDFR